MTGMTSRVRNVELNRPPMTTVPSSAAMIDPWLKPAASGISARIVAIAVMRIGRTRVRPPSMSASWVDIPFARSRSTRSSRTIALVTTIPISIRNPMSALTPSGLPVKYSAGSAPIVASGRLNRMMNGVISELNVSTIAT